MDHSEHPSAPLTATGWVIALFAALIAAGLMLIQGGQIAAVAVIGLVTFGVFGVLMGRGGVELTPPTHDGDHHGDHH